MLHAVGEAGVRGLYNSAVAAAGELDWEPVMK